MSCHLYQNSQCILSDKIIDKNLLSHDCGGDIHQCCFAQLKIEEKQLVKKTSSSIFECKVSVHKVDNPYLVKADVLVYPTTNTLDIDDALLLKMSKRTLQKDCDMIKRPIRMGTVYSLDVRSDTHLKVKKIYLSTVAGTSRLVNEKDIKSSLRKALERASGELYTSLVVLPGDCATHDINLTAMSQISATYTYLKSHQETNLKNIYFVMQDEESKVSFDKYFNKIFKGS